MLEVVKKEKEQVKERRIEISYDKQELVSAIQIWFRKKEIPENYVGTDLLRGTIYGIARHPERTIEEAISGTILYCNFPCIQKTIDAGLENIWDLLSEMLGYLEEGENCDRMQKVDEFVRNAVEELRKDYCLELSKRVIEKEFKSVVSMIGAMLYKKLCDDSSSVEEMCEYAVETVSRDTIIMRKACDLLPNDMTLEDYVNHLADRAYELEQATTK